MYFILTYLYKEKKQLCTSWLKKIHVEMMVDVVPVGCTKYISVTYFCLSARQFKYVSKTLSWFR